MCAHPFVCFRKPVDSPVCGRTGKVDIIIVRRCFVAALMVPMFCYLIPGVFDQCCDDSFRSRTVCARYSNSEKMVN